MTRDWDHRTFSEMATSTGDGEKKPYEIPLIVQISRTDDRGTGTYTGSGSNQRPFDIPQQTTTTYPPRNDGTGTTYTGAPTTVNGRGGDWNPAPINNGQFRSGWGGVAPGALDATNPNRQQTGQQTTDGGYTGQPSTPFGNGQWRSGYGGVAPGALDATSPGRQQNGDPNAAGGRAGYGRDLPPMGDPNYNGGVGAPGTPKWDGVDHSGNPATQGGRMTGDASNGNDPVATVGNNWNAGINQPTDQQKADIQNSLHTHFNYMTHFVEGGIGGVLGSSVLPWAGDKLFWRKGLDGNPIAEYWRNNHSPLGLQLRTSDGTIAELTQSGSELQTAVNESQAAYMKSLREAATPRMEMRGIQKQAAADFAADPANLAVGKKAQLFDDMLKSRPATPDEFATLRARIDGARLPSDTSPLTEASYLTKAEADLLRKSLDGYKGALADKTVLEGMKGQLEHNAQQLAAQQAVRDEVRARGGDFNALGTNKTWTDNVRPGAGKVETELTTWKGNEGPLGKGRAFAEGVGVVSAGLAANYLVDKYMPNMFGLVGGADAKAEDHWRSYLQGPVIAGALLMPNKSTLWKVSAAVAGTVGLGVAEHMFPEKANGSYSKLMQPNWIDSVGMGAAWMLPFSSWKSRAIAVGVTYGVARGADFLNNVVGIHVPGIGDQNFAVGMSNDAAQAIASKSLSRSSFNDVASTNFKLGMENEGALLANLGTTLNDRSSDPLNHLQQTAGLYTALGQVYDERGTRIVPGTLNDKGRILAGEHYDLGGQATNFYRQAVANLVEGQNQAKQKGNNDAASAMADAQRDVQKLLDKEYGQHDINNIYNKLQKEYEQNIGGMATFQVNLKNQVTNLQTRDTAYAAKMCRDIALLEFAKAAYESKKNNGGDASVDYKDAMNFLAAAERIDGNNPDVKQIRQIADSLKGSVGQATTNQYNNKINNPFGVPNTGTGG